MSGKRCVIMRLLRRRDGKAGVVQQMIWNAEAVAFMHESLTHLRSVRPRTFTNCVLTADWSQVRPPIERHDTIALLMTTYTEHFATYGPGRLLDFHLLRHLYQTRPGAIVDFCNSAINDELRRATDVHSLATITVFRPPCDPDTCVGRTRDASLHFAETVGRRQFLRSP
jgi:hypothetical protein